ncbi:MAG TPA: 3'-5' exonuclease, partial [Anaerovoracaceae bacterium]|nr:3'-5' exonuclease [Anaerovoracaceae bacterium]
VIKADSIDLLDKKIIEEAVYSKNQGYQSIGIICKDAQESKSLYSRLKDRLSLYLVHSGENLNTAGVFIIPITMSKGLEFDSVLIYGVNKESYHSTPDKKLLYIASTRALHRLNLFYTGEKSAFIGGGMGI